MNELLERVLERLCEHRLLLTAMFGLSVFFLVIQLPYLFVVTPGSALFVVSVLNITGLLVFVVGSSAGLWYCRRQRTHGWQQKT